MKIFISNKFRGENKKELKRKLKKILSLLEKKGYKTFNSFRDMDNWEIKELPPGRAIYWAFKTIRKCDALLCFVDTQKRGQGMLLEFGFARALNKKTILLISKKCSFPTLETVADRVIKFNNWEDINKKLRKNSISSEF